MMFRKCMTGSTPPASTRWTLHEHLLFQRRLCRQGVAVMSKQKSRVKVLMLPWPSVFYFLCTCTPLHKAVENFQYDVLLTEHTFRFSHFLQLGWESSSCPWYHASGSLFQKARFHKIAIFIDNPDQMCYITQKEATERGIAA